MHLYFLKNASFGITRLPFPPDRHEIDCAMGTWTGLRCIEPRIIDLSGVHQLTTSEHDLVDDTPVDRS